MYKDAAKLLQYSGNIVSEKCNFQVDSCGICRVATFSTHLSQRTMQDIVQSCNDILYL